MSLDASESVRAGAVRDQLEISPLAQLLDGIGQIGDVRFDKVNEIRAQIASGSYESPEKLELALDRLLEELRAW
jgi:negative regulator of flagellin synthesis FlgM